MTTGKTLFLLLALCAVLGTNTIFADFSEEVDSFTKKPSRWLAERLVDYKAEEDTGDGHFPVAAPEAEAFSDLAAFHASHSSSPTLIRAAHALRSAAKVAATSGTWRKSKDSRKAIKEATDTYWPVAVGSVAETLSMGTNSLHRAFHDLPDSVRMTIHASPVAARNAKQSEFADKKYKRERLWQWALLALQYLAAAAERNQMNVESANRDSYVRAWQAGTGTLRNLLRLWQQARLSNYYKQNLEYALHPEKEEAAIQAQLDEKKKKRLLWEERKRKLGNLPGNVWHFMRDKGFDPVAAFGKKKWDRATAFVQGLMKKE